MWAVFGEVGRFCTCVVACRDGTASAGIALRAPKGECRCHSLRQVTDIDPLVDAINGALLTRAGARGLARLATLALG